VHRNSRQGRVVYGKPAAAAGADLARAFSAKWPLITTTKSLAAVLEILKHAL